MQFNIHPFPADLKPYLKIIWSISENCPHGLEGEPECPPCQSVPTGCAELFFSYNARQTGTCVGILSGARTVPMPCGSTPIVNLISIMLNPHTLHALLGAHPPDITDRQIDIATLLGKTGAVLVDRVNDQTTPNLAAQVLIEFLCKQLGSGNHEVLPVVREYICTTTQTGGQTRIETLASKLNISRRQLERQVLANTGLTPKQFSRIIRFQYVLSLKQHTPSISLTELAYDAGYSDQSHFIKDFKRLSGYSPKNYFTIGAAFSDYYTFL